MLYRVLGFVVLVTLGGCIEPVAPVAPPQSQSGGGVSSSQFSRVINDVMPVAIRTCRSRQNPGMSCDFVVALDTNPASPPNAYQTEQDDGRPLLVFTAALLADLSNTDELAFILGHEAAHHIQGHLAETNQNAMTGAVVTGLVASVLGADSATIETAARIGAGVGGRAYSKGFELEADSLGAEITQRAGYDAVRGAAYFTRIADPGNRFLGTHPANADRIRVVRSTVANM